MATQPHIPLFSPTPRSTLIVRLGRALADAAHEIKLGPAAYLKTAFLANGIKDWLPARFLKQAGIALAELARHPIRFISNAFSSTAIAPRSRLFRYVLAASGALHFVLISFLIYIAVLSFFTQFRVVNKGYRQLDVSQVLGPLRYPPGYLRRQTTGPTMSLEEIRERDRKRREEAARREQERLERERAEREKAERERAEKEKAEKGAQANVDAAKKDGNSTPTQFGEINEAPIKDIVGKVYAMYKDGKLDVEVTNFSVMATFKIERDGSLSNIKLIKSSGSKVIDENAIEILWRIGESHALGPISDLTSNSIRLDLTDDMTRLTITGFASSPDIAKKKAELLNTLFFFLRMAQKNSVTAELASMIKVKSSGNRVDADMTISRARASEMMRARFGNGGE